jgi:hypothetical protein
MPQPKTLTLSPDEVAALDRAISSRWATLVQLSIKDSEGELDLLDDILERLRG